VTGYAERLSRQRRSDDRVAELLEASGAAVERAAAAVDELGAELDRLERDDRAALIQAVAAAAITAGDRTWVDVASILRELRASARPPSWLDDETGSASRRRAYEHARRRLWALERDGLLRASPKGQPPGVGGLLFAIRFRGVL
jgi:hypothetical protein